jgi:acetyl-CoA carboxylase biotin carboxyl carrier protein
MQLSLGDLEALLKTLETSGVSEFEYEDEKIRLRLGFQRGSEPGVAAGPRLATPVAASEAEPPRPSAPATDLATVTSPFVGTFYRAPSPGADDFVQVGQSVKKGQTLCIVEAMKLMNEIESDVSGTIVEILVENGKSVEYGQKLFIIKKS